MPEKPAGPPGPSGPPAHPGPPSGGPPRDPWKGPPLIPYNKNGVKFATMAYPPRQLDKIPDCKLESDDVVIATYAKAGTTWMQEIVYLIMNDADTTKAGKKSIEERYIFLEVGFPGCKAEMDKVEETPSPRLVKTHMPYELMQNQVNRDKCKFIVVMRNPKDNLVSMYHFFRTNRGLGLYPGTWDQWFDTFMRDTDNFVSGCPVSHNLSWWQNKNKDNVLFMFYEDMKEDLKGSIQKVANHLGKPLSEEKLETIYKATSFQSMKVNPATNYQEYKGLDQSRGEFIRKGEVGDWKNYFNAEQNEFLEKTMLKKLEGSDLKFRYEL